MHVECTRVCGTSSAHVYVAVQLLCTTQLYWPDTPPPPSTHAHATSSTPAPKAAAHHFTPLPLPVTHQDYLYLHREHSDWVTKVEWIPEIGLVTSSLDTTIKARPREAFALGGAARIVPRPASLLPRRQPSAVLCGTRRPPVSATSESCNLGPQVWDIARERMTHVCNHHTKGVHSFVWCKAYSLFASCGMERDVTIWQVGARAGLSSLQVSMPGGVQTHYWLPLPEMLCFISKPPRQGNTGRKLGELRGHTSSVSAICLNDNLNQVVGTFLSSMVWLTRVCCCSHQPAAPHDKQPCPPTFRNPHCEVHSGRGQDREGLGPAQPQVPPDHRRGEPPHVSGWHWPQDARSLRATHSVYGCSMRA